MENNRRNLCQTVADVVMQWQAAWKLEKTEE
jgi:hypothetical protein